MTAICRNICIISKIFQLTSSRRGWLCAIHLHHNHTRISTHILTKRMTINFPLSNIGNIFQLTSSRRGWHLKRFLLLHNQNISTHILTKRMTGSFFYSFYSIQHFNSHPHEEDDSSLSLLGSLSWYFNSHPHEEDDVSRCLFPSVKLFISTHILTKRMTFILLICFLCSLHFNSHPHEEDDQDYQLHTYHKNISTHILTKRMTILELAEPPQSKYFNSHPHEEDDKIVLKQG